MGLSPSHSRHPTVKILKPVNFYFYSCREDILHISSADKKKEKKKPRLAYSKRGSNPDSYIIAKRPIQVLIEKSGSSSIYSGQIHHANGKKKLMIYS